MDDEERWEMGDELDVEKAMEWMTAGQLDRSMRVTKRGYDVRLYHYWLDPPGTPSERV